MIDVVCFCGCSYSFADGDGACPQCGELVSFVRPGTAEKLEAREPVGALYGRSADESERREVAA